MTREEIRKAFETALGEIAPEIDLSTIDPARSFREQAEIDSFDNLNLLIRLHELTGVEIPESDYDQIQTLDGLIDYVKSRVTSDGN